MVLYLGGISVQYAISMMTWTKSSFTVTSVASVGKREDREGGREEGGREGGRKGGREGGREGGRSWSGGW